MGAPDWIIAVDGGGTRCRFALLGAGTRHDLTLGPANVFSDPGGAVAVLRQGIEALEAHAGASLARAPAYLALAGMIEPGIAARLAGDLPLARVKIEEDWHAALEGALGQRDGTVIGLGTGSFLARRSGHVSRAIGGHGLTLGDEASGAWLGRGALARALLAAEGMEPSSPLTTALLADFGGVPGIVRFGASAGAAAFGDLAPRVLAAAEDGDVHGLALIEAGVCYLNSGLAALGWTPEEALCLTGGLGPAYAKWLDPEGASLVAPRGTALDGAVVLAQRFAKETA